MRIAVIQNTSIAGFITASVIEVHRDPAQPSIGVYFQFILLLSILRLSLLCLHWLTSAFDYQGLLLQPAAARETRRA
jgi:hypothetical protein